MFKTTRALPIAAFLLAHAVSMGAWAADKACLIEGDIVVFGKTTPTKDCLENSGVPDDRFKAVCASLVQAAENLAKTFGGPTPKTTYLAACPPKATASCLGFDGQPMTSHYYKRDAKELAETKASCTAQGGKWQQ
ncbi:MAG: hypothetical protein RI907_3484 [Pseudomonadota bacterium]|jgi:hypothetical protein